MKFISEYLGLDPRIVFVLIVIFVLAVFTLVVMWFTSKRREDDLNSDLCTRGDDEDDEDVDGEPEDRFFTLRSYRLPDDWDETFSIIVDRQTKVQYLNYGVCGITPLIDSDGKPILYKDEYEEQEESE